MAKPIKVKFDKDGTAICIGRDCFYYTTYYYWGRKKLDKPIIRCCTDTCPLDKKITKEVNKQFEEWYPIKYKKPIETL